MIKRLLIVAAICLLPIFAFGQDSDRNILLTSDGTLYTIESVYRDAVPNLNTTSSRVLMLTIQQGATATSVAVPESLTGGWHVEPTLAYDSDSKTLYLFWEAAKNNGLSSELLVCTYQNGNWGYATSLDSIDWDLRQNLRIAITRKTEQTNPDGSTTVIPEVTVHAVWWQQSGIGEWARYAMLTMDKGNVSSIQIQNLSDFLSKPDAVRDTPVDNETLRHPIISESATRDRVDVFFGDVRADTMHHVTLKPVAQGRLRIPIGVRDDPILTPVAIADSAQGVSGFSASDGSLTYYYSGPQWLNYILYKNGTWSPLRSIALTGKLTAETAVEALRRMMNSE